MVTFFFNSIIVVVGIILSTLLFLLTVYIIIGSIIFIYEEVVFTCKNTYDGIKEFLIKCKERICR